MVASKDKGTFFVSNSDSIRGRDRTSPDGLRMNRNHGRPRLLGIEDSSFVGPHFSSPAKTSPLPRGNDKWPDRFGPNLPLEAWGSGKIHSDFKMAGRIARNVRGGL
jgi:hypothetical protein